MEEKSQKEKCKDWTYITAIIYYVLDVVEKQLGNDQIVHKVFDSFKIAVYKVNIEFNKAYNNNEYEEIEFPTYNLEDFIKLQSIIPKIPGTNGHLYSKELPVYRIDITNKTYDDVQLQIKGFNADFNWKEFVTGILSIFVPAISLFAKYFDGNKEKYGAFYTAINGLMDSIKDIQNIIAK